MSHQDQNPCPQHGEHHGICWPCADARGRKANAAEAALEAARAEVARMRPVVEAVIMYRQARCEEIVASLRSAEGTVNAIARAYDLDEVNLTSFMHHLSTVRNYCAHHSRLRNREFTFVWSLPTHRPAVLVGNLNHFEGKRLYNTLVMSAYLMDTINPGHHWKHRLGELFLHHPHVKARQMGFPDNWRELPPWRGKR